MTATPQTNATLEDISRVLLSNDHFCICGHVNPDGDCIGSTLALNHALKAAGKHTIPLVAGSDDLDPVFRFLPGAHDVVPASDYDGPCEVFVTVDAPCDERIGEEASRVRAKARITVTIDHHAHHERVSDYSYTDPDSASTTLEVWKLAGLMGPYYEVSQARDIATCCYAGLLTDTGRFMYQNTNEGCFEGACEMVSCGASPSEIGRCIFQERSLAAVEIDGVAAAHARLFADGRAVISWIAASDMESADASGEDTENSINVIRSIRGVEVACILKEREGAVRGSLRAKGDVNVAEIAREFGGGGHKAAAGFTLDMPLSEALMVVESRIAEIFS